MQAILDLMLEIFAWLFVDMDGADTVYSSGAVVEFINFLLATPLLAIGIGFGLVSIVITFTRRLKPM